MLATLQPRASGEPGLATFSSEPLTFDKADIASRRDDAFKATTPATSTGNIDGIAFR